MSNKTSDTQTIIANLEEARRQLRTGDFTPYRNVFTIPGLLDKALEGTAFTGDDVTDRLRELANEVSSLSAADSRQA